MTLTLWRYEKGETGSFGRKEIILLLTDRAEQAIRVTRPPQQTELELREVREGTFTPTPLLNTL